MARQEDVTTLQKVRRSLSFKSKEEKPAVPKKIVTDSWLKENTNTRKNNVKEGPPKNLR